VDTRLSLLKIMQLNKSEVSLTNHTILFFGTKVPFFVKGWAASANGSIVFGFKLF